MNFVGVIINNNKANNLKYKTIIIKLRIEFLTLVNMIKLMKKNNKHNIYNNIGIK